MEISSKWAPYFLLFLAYRPWKAPLLKTGSPWCLCPFSHCAVPLQPPWLGFDSSKGSSHPYILLLHLFFSNPLHQAKLLDKSLLKNIWELLIHVWSLWKTNSGCSYYQLSSLLSSLLYLSFFYLETVCWPDWNILSPHEQTAVPGNWSRKAPGEHFLAETRKGGRWPVHYTWDGGNEGHGWDVNLWSSFSYWKSINIWFRKSYCLCCLVTKSCLTLWQPDAL